MAREKQTAINGTGRPIRRETDAHRALEAGVRELVYGKWVIPAPTYFQYMARALRA